MYPYVTDNWSSFTYSHVYFPVQYLILAFARGTDAKRRLASCYVGAYDKDADKAVLRIPGLKGPFVSLDNLGHVIPHTLTQLKKLKGKAPSSQITSTYEHIIHTLISITTKSN